MGQCLGAKLRFAVANLQRTGNRMDASFALGKRSGHKGNK